MFDVKDHITFRKTATATITNSQLLGLTTVEINPTELCNRTCSFCPRSNPKIYGNRNLHMDTVTADLLVYNLLQDKFDGEIHITGFGEPMLNPNIIDIVRVCSVFHTQVITNGDRIMEDNPSYRELVNVGLQTLIIDCYDGDDQVKAVTKKLRKCPIDYRIRNHYDDGKSNKYSEYNFTNRGGLMYEVKSLQKPCYLPFYKAFIDWNGDVGLCCNDWQRNNIFGNVYHTKFSEIWMSNEMIEVRKHLNTGSRNKISACSNCDIDGQQVGIDSVNIWKTK
jgi:radical SAM protein with 4Fe4S-binding SPASM domain